MKDLVQHINGNITYAKVVEWTKLLTFTGAAQVFVQAMGFLSGILVIRLLPTSEYAFYILCNTLLGTMTILADGGISTGVLSQGGKVWKDKAELGKVLATGQALRKKFALLSFILAAPGLYFLLRHHGAGVMMSTLLITSLIPAFLATISRGLLEIAPKLHQDIIPLQRIQISENIGRLAILSFTLFAFPWAFIAVFSAGIPQIIANGSIRKISSDYTDIKQKPDPVIRTEIIGIVKRILPGSVYYCISGQLTIWLISIFGSTTAVAQMGGLGRLAMVLTVFNVLITTLVIPRFARFPSVKSLLLNRFLLINLSLIIVSACIIYPVYRFPSEVLWVLGKDYSNLESELILTVTGTCLGFFSSASYSLYTSRGWTINPIIAILINLSSIIMGILLFDISSIQGILVLSIFTTSIGILVYAILNLYEILSIK